MIATQTPVAIDDRFASARRQLLLTTLEPVKEALQAFRSTLQIVEPRGIHKRSNRLGVAHLKKAIDTARRRMLMDPIVRRMGRQFDFEDVDEGLIVPLIDLDAARESCANVVRASVGDRFARRVCSGLRRGATEAMHADDGGGVLQLVTEGAARVDATDVRSSEARRTWTLLHTPLIANNRATPVAFGVTEAPSALAPGRTVQMTMCGSWRTGLEPLRVLHDDNLASTQTPSSLAHRAARSGRPGRADAHGRALSRQVGLRRTDRDRVQAARRRRARIRLEVGAPVRRPLHD